MSVFLKTFCFEANAKGKNPKRQLCRVVYALSKNAFDVQFSLQNMHVTPRAVDQCQTSLPMQRPKRKGRFNIGLYAKRRKLHLEHCVKEKIENDSKVKHLENRIIYAKRKVGEEQTFSVYIFSASHA